MCIFIMSVCLSHNLKVTLMNCIILQQTGEILEQQLSFLGQ